MKELEMNDENSSNKLWQTLGSMQTDLSYVRKAMESMEESTKLASETIIKHTIQIDAAHKRIDLIEPVLESLKWWKVKMVVTGTVLGTVFGAICYVVEKVFDAS